MVVPLPVAAAVRSFIAASSFVFAACSCSIAASSLSPQPARATTPATRRIDILFMRAMLAQAVALDIFLYRYMILPWHERRRQQILDVLAGGERPVNDLVRALGLAQPQVSKHLRVLREVGAVDVREEGRQRLYRLNGHALKPIHDWVKDYERTWSERFGQLDVVLEELKTKEQGDGVSDE